MWVSKIKSAHFAYCFVFLIGISIICLSKHENDLVKVLFKNYLQNGTFSTSSRENDEIKVTHRKDYIEYIVRSPKTVKTQINKEQIPVKDQKQTPKERKSKSYLHGGVPLHDIPFIVDNKHRCDNNAKLDYFIYIYSAPGEFQHRKRIRDTWAKPYISDSLRFHGKYAFFIGQKQDKKIMAKLNQEIKIHKDIVLLGYIDSYWNVTHKGVTALKWMSLYCNRSRYYIKVDSDVLLNIFVLKPTIETYLGQAKRTVMCKTIYGVVKRNEATKEQYPASRYPLYCYGPVWIFTADLLDPLYSATFKVPFIGVEDAYTTGLLPKYIGNVRFLVPSHPWILQHKPHGARIPQYKSKEIELMLTSVPKPEEYGLVWLTILERIVQKNVETLHKDYSKFLKSEKRGQLDRYVPI